MLNILIVDDHPVVREGLIRIIEKMPDMKVAGQAESGSDALQKIRQNEYDLILLDISMPDRDGMDIISEIKSLRPNTPVLVLTIHSDSDYALRMFKLGASGYLTKDRASQDLIDAIQKVIHGEKYIDSVIAKSAFFDYNINNQKKIHESLTNREYQIMLKIAEGNSVKDIARELNLSIKTVLTHRTHIFEKMGFKNDAQIVNYAFRNKLVA
jgi:two-component system, NarL family, invasion response regulator UvrY